MTVPVQPTVFQHTGNGVTTVFAFDCLVVLTDDLIVYLNGIQQASGYSIAGLGVDTGGTVTFSTAPGSGVIVTLSREVALEREIDYQNNGDLRSPTLNNDFDRIWMALQGLGSKIGRAVRVALYDPTPDVDLVLPEAGVRANQFLVFDASGKVSLSTGTGADAGLRADLADDADASKGVSLVGGARRTLASMSGLVGGQWLDDAVEVVSFYDGWAATVAGPKGRSVWHYDGTTGGTPTANNTTAIIAAMASRKIIDAAGRGWVLSPDTFATPYVYGATGGNVGDDRPSFQSAVDAEFSLTGGNLFVPDDVYLINGTVNIGLSAGWLIKGESRLGTIIRQAAANTQTFKFTKENTHSWAIKSLTLDYANAQPSTNTLAIALYFDFDTHTGSGAYLWALDDIHFDKGFMLAATNSAAANLVWGQSIDRITTGTLVSGGLLRFDPNPNAGQPSIKMGHLYIRGDAMTQPIIFIAAANGCVIDCLEVNNSTNVPLLKLEGGGTVEVKELKVENCDFTSANSHIVDFTDSQINIGTFVLGNTGFALGAGNKFYCFRKSGAGAAGVSVGTFSAQGNTLTSGDAYVFSTSADNTPVRIENMRSIDVLYLTDIASSAGADNCFVTEWGKPRISTDNGDADLTLAVGDETTQMFATTLTANRDVNLPPGHAANPSNLFNGLTYKIIRNAVTPGAFTLTVKNSAGTTIKQIPNSTNAAVEVTYRRGGWVLTNYTVL